MRVKEDRDAKLVKKIRDNLTRGKNIAVVGWRDSNHDENTREMKEFGRVIFYLDSPMNLGGNIGFVMATPFITHSNVKRLRKIRDTHSKVMTTGLIREILKACEDLLLTPRRTPVVEKLFDFPPLTKQVVMVIPQVATAQTLEPEVPSVSEVQTEVSVMLTVPKETKEMEPIDKFVLAFMEKKGESAEGLVGKVNLGKLSRDAGLTLTNSQLVTLHWVEPVVSEGRAKAGTYRATAKMRERFETLSKPEAEPTDPIRRAQWLIAQRPKVLGELEKIAEYFEEQKRGFEAMDLSLREKLRKIDNLIELMGKLDDQLK